MDCKIILAVVHGWSVPSFMSLSSFSLLLLSAPPSLLLRVTRTIDDSHRREREGCMDGGQKRWQQHKENKGNKGMFCVASVWCYCDHLNVLSDLSLSLSAWRHATFICMGPFGPRYTDGGCMVSTLDHGRSVYCCCSFITYGVMTSIFFGAVIQTKKKGHACELLYMCSLASVVWCDV